MTRTIFTLLMLVFTFGQLNAQEDASSMSELLRPVSYTHLTLPTKA